MFVNLIRISGLWPEDTTSSKGITGLTEKMQLHFLSLMKLVLGTLFP